MLAAARPEASAEDLGDAVEAPPKIRRAGARERGRAGARERRRADARGGAHARVRAPRWLQASLRAHAAQVARVVHEWRSDHARAQCMLYTIHTYLHTYLRTYILTLLHPCAYRYK